VQNPRLGKAILIDWLAGLGSRSGLRAIDCRRYRSPRRLVRMNLRPIMADRGWLDHLHASAICSTNPTWGPATTNAGRTP